MRRGGEAKGVVYALLFPICKKGKEMKQVKGHATPLSPFFAALWIQGVVGVEELQCDCLKCETKS